MTRSVGYPSAEANYPASIRQPVSAAASLLFGVCAVLLLWDSRVSLAGGRVGGFITSVFVLPMGFLLLHSHGWRKMHADIIGRSEGVVCSRTLCLMQLPWGGLKEQCWRAPKVKILCECTARSIQDVNEHEPSCFVLNNIGFFSVLRLIL